MVRIQPTVFCQLVFMTILSHWFWRFICQVGDICSSALRSVSAVTVPIRASAVWRQTQTSLCNVRRHNRQSLACQHTHIKYDHPKQLYASWQLPHREVTLTQDHVYISILIYKSIWLRDFTCELYNGLWTSHFS